MTRRRSEWEVSGSLGRRDGGGDVGARKQALLLSCLALPLLVGSYVLVLTLWSRPAAPGREARLDEFLGLLAGKQVQSAVILPTDERIAGRSLRGDFWVDVSGGHESLFARLTGAMEQAGVPFSVRRQPLRQLLGPVSTVLPALIGVDALLIVILLASRGGAGGFGRSGARRADPAGSLTFADLAGVDEAVEELAEVAQYLAQPQRFASMGAAVCCWRVGLGWARPASPGPWQARPVPPGRPTTSNGPPPSPVAWSGSTG